jgi:hypothetical protein
MYIVGCGADKTPIPFPGGFMRWFSCCVFAVCVLSGAAMAQSQIPPADAPAPPKEKEALICVDQNPTASTRVNSQRICRTREEWEKRGGVPK